MSWLYWFHALWQGSILALSFTYIFPGAGIYASDLENEWIYYGFWISMNPFSIVNERVMDSRLHSVPHRSSGVSRGRVYRGKCYTPPPPAKRDRQCKHLSPESNVWVQIEREKGWYRCPSPTPIREPDLFLQSFSFKKNIIFTFFR